jgi:hypothetical protein
VFTAVADADYEAALADWRRFRRRKRLADVHWIDAVYHAYLTALLGSVAAYLVAGAIGDDKVSVSELASIRAHGAAWLGAAAAAVFALGLRSGSRGGPLALERAEVRHVLLAPVDRTTALRGPVWRQLRFLVFVAAVSGALAGELAHRRLSSNGLGLVVCGALFAGTAIALGYGAALCVSAWRVPSWAATAIGVAVVGWSVADGLGKLGAAPFTAVGQLALWPVRFHWLALVALVAAGTVLASGLVRVGDLSVEAAERRSTLVGQLRFAATLQDIRTVIVLRRQLAMELPRLRPWIWLRVRGSGRLPVFVRGLRGVLRWPAARLGRLVLLGTVAGLSLRAVWAGTTPMLLIAGLAMFVAGLDALEPLAQEIDHPSRSDSVPMDQGDLYLRHVPIAVLVMVPVAAVGAIAAVLADPSRGALEVAAVCVVPAALGAVGGALVSVIGGAPTNVGGDSWSLLPPEVAGTRLAFRTAWPPAIAVAGTLPVLAARVAADHGRRGPAGAAVRPRVRLGACA